MFHCISKHVFNVMHYLSVRPTLLQNNDLARESSPHIAVGMFPQCKWQSIVHVACTPMVELKGKIMGMKEQISVSICLSVCVFLYVCVHVCMRSVCVRVCAGV